MYMEQRIEYIRSLPALSPELLRKVSTFANDPEPPTPPGDINDPAASITPDSMNIFMPGVSDSIISDVNLCKLVMQNAADCEFPHDSQIFEWFKFYIDGLSTLGWVVQARGLQEVTIKGVNLTMDQVALDVIKGLIGDKANLLANLANQVVNTVKNDEKLITLFESNKKLGKQSKFNITPAWVDSSKQANMVLNCIFLDVQESSTGVLFWKTNKKSTVVKSGAMHTYLDNSVFNDLRGVLREEFLGDAKSKIKNLPRLKKN